LSKAIEIIVAPNGQLRVDTKGFVGDECRQASEFIERALGQTSNEQLKAEFHQAANVQQQTSQN
jgi:hypothetical protein